MKKSIYIFFVLAVFVGCQDKSHPPIVEKKVDIFNEGDTAYYFVGRFSIYDSLNHKYYALETLRDFDKLLFDYNDSLLQVVQKNKIIPLKIGITGMKIRYPNNEIDSFKVEINKVNGNYSVNKLPA